MVDARNEFEQSKDPLERMNERYQGPKWTISDIFRMFCRRTNGHGWRRIVRAPSLKGTMFWFLLSFAFFAGACIYTTSVLIDYLEYETEQSIESTAGDQRFPAVTVCSINPIKDSMQYRAEPSSYRDSLAAIPAKMKRQLTQINKVNDLDLDPQYEAYKDIVYASDYTSKFERQALGYTVDELVSYCAFGEKICDSWRSTVSTHHDPHYGNCFTWNNDDSAGAVGAGSQKGLHLILNIATNDYLRYYTTSEAAVVVIHEPGTMPLPVSKGLTIPSGKETNLALEGRRYKRLADPYNDPGCSNDYKEFVSRFGFVYSTLACHAVCHQLTVLEQCACADARQAPLVDNTTPFCNDSDRNTIACLATVDYNFVQQPLDYCQCPMKCDEMEYNVKIHISSWPAMPDARFKSAYGFSSNETASVRIYFRTPLQLVYKDIAKQTIFQFVGWLGGQLYVWCGASMFTIIEFIGMTVACLLVLFTENIDWLIEDNNVYQY